MAGTKRAVLALAMGLGAAGCAHARMADQSQTVTQSHDSGATHLTAVPKPIDSTRQEDSAQQALAQALAKLENARLFFGYDSADITDEAKQSLTNIGEILAKNPRLSVRIEGNCDERGTEDYNLSLGQRRASAAERYLFAMGAREGQVETLSYGAERPLARSHDESAWRQNRRDDVVVRNQ